MKPIIYTFLGLVLCSCSSNTESTDGFDQAAIDEKYAAGKAVYDRSCISCHQPDGLGMEGVFPPLAGSDYLLEDKVRAAKQVMEGLQGPIKVNGVNYDGIMPPQELSKEETKAVMDYILNSWNNGGGELSLDDF